MYVFVVTTQPKKRATCIKDNQIDRNIWTPGNTHTIITHLMFGEECVLEQQCRSSSLGHTAIDIS